MTSNRNPGDSPQEIDVRSLVYGWAKRYSLVISDHDVDELCQEIAKVVVGRFHSLVASGPSIMFARRVAQYKVIDLLRGRKREPRSVHENQASIVDESSSSAIQAVEVQDALYWCLEKLRERWRQVIRMHMRGCAYKTISEELGITIDSVKQDAMQARNSLRRCLEAQHAFG